MFNPAARIVCRHSLRLRQLTKRNASTTAQMTETAKEKSSQAVSQASQGLSKATNSASSTLNKASDATGRAANNVGGRVGRMINLMQASIPRIAYVSRVGLELGKAVVESRKMQPPSMAAIQSYMQQLRHTMRNPQSLIRATSQLGLLDLSTMMSRIRSVDRQQMIDASVIGAELLGFFTVGQMIGRMKLVGYHSDKSAAAHH